MVLEHVVAARLLFQAIREDVADTHRTTACEESAGMGKVAASNYSVLKSECRVNSKRYSISLLSQLL